MTEANIPLSCNGRPAEVSAPKLTSQPLQELIQLIPCLQAYNMSSAIISKTDVLGISLASDVSGDTTALQSSCIRSLQDHVQGYYCVSPRSEVLGQRWNFNRGTSVSRTSACHAGGTSLTHDPSATRWQTIGISVLCTRSCMRAACQHPGPWSTSGSGGKL